MSHAQFLQNSDKQCYFEYGKTWMTSSKKGVSRKRTEKEVGLVYGRGHDSGPSMGYPFAG